MAVFLYVYWALVLEGTGYYKQNSWGCCPHIFMLPDIHAGENGF